MKKTFPLILTMLALGGMSGFAVPIDGLFNTGIDASGNVVTDHSVDLHYVLTPLVGGKEARVLTKDTSWLTPPGDSRWIGPATALDATFPGGGGDPIAPPATFLYTTTFSIDAGFSTASISGLWATDTGGQIFLNGNLIAAVTPDIANYQTLVAFQTSVASYFIFGGVNTLSFNVYNGLVDGQPPGPSGLLVSGLVGTAPDGGMTAVLLGAAVSGIAFLRRKIAA